MYNVKPFSGKHYAKNAAKAGDKTPCAICGKAIRNPDTAHWAIVIDGGGAWGDETSDPNDAGYMGGFPVGPDCHRRHLITRPQYFAIEDSRGIVPVQFATGEDMARALCDTCNKGQPEGRYAVVPLVAGRQADTPTWEERERRAEDGYWSHHGRTFNATQSVHAALRAAFPELAPPPIPRP